MGGMSQQSQQVGSGGDFYLELEHSATRQIELISQPNAKSDEVDIEYKAAVQKLNELQMPEKEKTQFVIWHIDQELVELQKHEILLKMLLHQLAYQHVNQDQLAPLAKTLKRNNESQINPAIIACLIKLESRGMPVFSENRSMWGPVLESCLESNNGKMGILTQHVLEMAEHDQWKPYGTLIFPEWYGAEKEEIADTLLNKQKNILARHYVEEKFEARQGGSK
jgi:hypothetical protein